MGQNSVSNFMKFLLLLFVGSVKQYGVLLSEISWLLPITPFSSFVLIVTVLFNVIYSQKFLFTVGALSWERALAGHFCKFTDCSI